MFLYLINKSLVLRMCLIGLASKELWLARFLKPPRAGITFPSADRCGKTERFERLIDSGETMFRYLLLVAVLAGVTACNSKPEQQVMPEVNDKNCTLESIQKLTDKDMQQEFSGKCLRRGSLAPSPPRKW